MKRKEEKLMELKQKMTNLCGEEYSLLSTEFINMRTKIKIKHNKCGTVFEIRPDAFFRQKNPTRCPNKKCVKQRIENTNLKRFGYKSSLESPKIQQKIKDTMIRKYGVDSFFKNGLIQNSMNEKYGFKSSHQTHIVEPYATISKDKEKLLEWKKQFFEKNKYFPTLSDFCNVSGYSPSAIYKIFNENNIGISEIFDTTSSIYEKEIEHFLEQNDISYISHERGIITPLELDFFIPDFNIAIEVNGAYFHNSTKDVMNGRPPKDRLYHQKKSLECESKGIRLIHIFEWELYPKNIGKTLGFLRSIFKVSQQRIFARKCVIKEILSKEANDFYDKNHLQGKTNNCKFNYGLFYDNILVSCMSFSKGNEQYTLTRFCSKIDIEVVGGASKLFKHFLKTENPQIIVSFSDITKMSGNVYKILGFKIERITAPSYWWFHNPSSYYWRRDCQKQYMHKLNGFNKDYKYLEHKKDLFWQRSEKEIMESKGYLQIFDSGMRKHVWRKENMNE